MADQDARSGSSSAVASSSTAVIAEDVHVTYRVYTERRPRLREVVTRRFRRPSHREIPAVRGISFEAQTGEVVGIIGPNGSGKSTLLRSLAGLLPPTSGAVFARSRPMLLGVGAALRPDSSGRRNIMIGCLALGMTRGQALQHEPGIIEFSGLEDFIDLPMRTYSSGMRARLHFSIATAVTPEILLIDEALAVGDRDFKKKSAARIEQIRKEAGTVFLVTHSLSEVRKSCTRVLWIEDGLVKMDGGVDNVLAAYTAGDPAE